MQSKDDLDKQALDSAQVEQPEQEKAGVAKPEKQKNERKLILIIVLLAILAISGWIFGIIAMLSGKDAGHNDGTVGVFESKVISSPNEGIQWSQHYSSPTIAVANGVKSVGINLKNGEVVFCTIESLIEEASEDGKSTEVVGSENECVVSGLVNDVYKMAEFGSGLTPTEFNLGFIMLDGTVYYVNLADAIEKNDFAVKGPLNIAGYVTDSIVVELEPTEENPAGGLSSVFVLQDGSMLEFDKSMLK